MALQKQKLSALTIKCSMQKVLCVSTISGALNGMSNISGTTPTPLSSVGPYHSDNELLSSEHHSSKVNKCSHHVTWYMDPAVVQKACSPQSVSGSKSLSSKPNKPCFDSTAFQLYRARWCLQCYPNGDKYANSGMVSLYLKLLEFPDSNGVHLRNMKVRMQFESPDIQLSCFCAGCLLLVCK